MCWPVGNLCRILYTRTASRLCVPACDESGYSARWKPMKEKRKSLINHLQFIQCEHHLLFHIHSNQLDKIRHLPFRTLHTVKFLGFSVSRAVIRFAVRFHSVLLSQTVVLPHYLVQLPGEMLFMWVLRCGEFLGWNARKFGVLQQEELLMRAYGLCLRSSRLLRKINVRSAARTGDKPSPSNWNSTTIR